MSAAEYRITFGVQYGRNGRGGKTVHPGWTPADADGWLTVVNARDADHVRQVVQSSIVGKRYAFDYAPPFDDKWARYYPLGELGVLDARTGVLTDGAR